jgi:hypothetical protein
MDYKNEEIKYKVMEFIENCICNRQGIEGNSRHSDRNIRGTCTIICHCQKLGGPV